MKDLIEEQKAQLRRHAREYLRSQTPQTALGWGQAMAAELFAHPLWQKARTLFCFVSTPFEPDTAPILQAAFESGRTVCVPRTCCIAGEMDAVAIHSLSQLSCGRFNLSEPPSNLPAASPRSIDLVIAPCLMAGTDGTRLGQGGGYYDRFLARCTCPVVVLCPSALTQASLPLALHDRPADLILTENGFLK